MVRVVWHRFKVRLPDITQFVTQFRGLLLNSHDPSPARAPSPPEALHGAARSQSLQDVANQVDPDARALSQKAGDAEVTR